MISIFMYYHYFLLISKKNIFFILILKISIYLGFKIFKILNFLSMYFFQTKCKLFEVANILIFIIFFFIISLLYNWDGFLLKIGLNTLKIKMCFKSSKMTFAQMFYSYFQKKQNVMSNLNSYLLLHHKTIFKV